MTFVSWAWHFVVNLLFHTISITTPWVTGNSEGNGDLDSQTFQGKLYNKTRNGSWVDGLGKNGYFLEPHNGSSFNLGEWSAEAVRLISFSKRIWEAKEICGTSIKWPPFKRPPSIKRPFFKVPNYFSVSKLQYSIPLLNSQPLLSGQFSKSRGWPLNRGPIVYPPRRCSRENRMSRPGLQCGYNSANTHFRTGFRTIYFYITTWFWKLTCRRHNLCEVVCYKQVVPVCQSTLLFLRRNIKRN